METARFFVNANPFDLVVMNKHLILSLFHSPKINIILYTFVQSALVDSQKSLQK